MNIPLRKPGRPHLRVVRGSRLPQPQEPAADWRRVARAVLACTYELAQHLVEHRWSRVDEALRERRELLAGFGRMTLDTEGRSCLRSLTQAADESECALASMMVARRQQQ
jgi:hypothetical protein